MIQTAGGRQMIHIRSITCVIAKNARRVFSFYFYAGFERTGIFC